MFGPGASTSKITRAVTGAVPIFLAGSMIYAIWVVIDRICFGYFQTKGWTQPSHAVVTLLAVLLLLTGASYMRTYLVIQTNPGLIPLPPRKVNARASRRRGGPNGSTNTNEASFDPTAAYQTADGAGTGGSDGNRIEDAPLNQTAVVTEMRHDDPALDVFYSMDAFVCDVSGHPLFCYNCKTWKPDRAHHSGEVGRCFRKMDHYCPWVGGMVAETSFKFFLQFVFYASLFCALCLAVSATTLAGQLSEEGRPVDPNVCVVLGLSAFFFLFSSAMTLTAMRYVLLNTTNVDALDMTRKQYRLAIRIPGPSARAAMSSAGTFTGLVVYPLNRTAFLPRAVMDGVMNTDTAVPEEGEEETDEARDRRHSRIPDAAGPPRDPARERFFAVVTTREGENPWDRGYRENFRSVMGDGGPLDWLLPIRPSPCVREWDNDGFYRFGPLIEELRVRHRLGRMGDMSEKAPLL